MMEHADILKQMARDSLEVEIRHTYYLQAMIVMKDAVSNMEEVLIDIQTLYSLQEVKTTNSCMYVYVHLFGAVNIWLC